MALQDGWTSGSDSQVPLLYETSMSQRVSDRFLHDASYIRLQSLSLGYTFPESISKKIYMEQLRIYVSGTNLITFTDFPGYDPNGLYSNYNSMTPLDAGLVMFDPPQPRTIMFGVQFTF
jgi:hypothetical protein